MPRRTLDIQFPRLGVVRRFGLRPSGQQEEFGTPYSCNVRLEDSLTARLRGGSFTGISAGARVDPVYRDRAITFSDNAITAARQGNASDTSLSTDVSDTARPILFQLSEAGSVGGDVVAVIPHKDSHLICFTAGETWVLAGDPATGSLRRVSDEVGCMAKNAWCVYHDTAYFLSSSGLYSVGADGSGLKALSEDVIPEELTGVSDAACTLRYQHSDRGVYIHKTGIDWFYDTERGQFWPFDKSTAASHVLIGPFQLGQVNSYGRVLNLHGNIATGSDDVTWRIVTGDTAEEAAANGKLAIEAALAGTSYSSYVKSSGTWSAGRSHTTYPRISAMYAVLWLSSAGQWSYEGCTLGVVESGRWR